jgi:hypothetical protein
MSTHSKQKKSKANKHVIVRNNISLNKDVHSLLNKYYTPDHKLWTDSWLEQSTEMKLSYNVVNPVLLKHTKLTIKWWEN